MDLVFAALLSTLAAAPTSEPAPPNVILVMADDQGYGDMGYQGHPTLETPNFDAMAEECLRFDRFYAAAPVCSPTRGSVMTGRHPNRFGCFTWGHTLRPQEVTIAEALKEVGYTTGHFGKWHLGSVRKGSPVNPGASGFDQWISAPNFFDNDPILSYEGRAMPTEGESSMVTADLALSFIARCAEDREPFLAVVWFGSPHSPHRSVEEDRKLYEDQPAAMQHFLGEITGMDRALGRIRRALGPLGIQENTILWYCSDNGALPRVGSAGPFRGHKGQIYEGGLRVPAMIQWPARIREPRRCEVRANTSDILPTILDAAGVSTQGLPPLDGVSLMPIINGEEMSSRPGGMGFWEHPTGGIRTPSAEWMAELLAAQQAGREPGHSERLRLDAGEIKQTYPLDSFPGHAAWIDGDWKLHRIADKNGQNVRFELYHLIDDPDESDNRAEDEPERVAAMKSSLEAWLQSVVRSLNGEDYDRAP